MMEISPDILSINGILVSAKAEYGDISKIIYKGLVGEDAILYIQECLQLFLKNKNYLEKDVPKFEFRNYFEELSLLFLVNCEFRKPLEIQEYEHLTSNVPKLSKYLIAKVIVDTNLVEFFCTAVQKLPLEYSCEIFAEFPPIMDKEEPNRLIKDTYCILSTIGNISSKNKELKYSDDMDRLLRNVPDFLFYMTRVPKYGVLKNNTLYKRAGLVLEKFFSLLFLCHKNEIMDGIFIDKLIESTTAIVRAVTLDMFLYWAEIDIPSGSLQSHLAESAYLINAKYQHHKPAADLIASLKPFAAKPKDIKEQLHSADLKRMVFMVNKADENQQKWFQGLIFSSFFSDKDAMECLEKWAHLCDEEDVSRLLNQSVKVKDEKPKKLALKCASLLNLEQLIVVAIRHFYNNGFVVLNNNQHEIVSWFNKLKDSDSVTQEASHNLLFFILENPDFSIHFIMTECIKSEFYISSLYDCFIKLKDIWRIHDICLKNLSELIRNKPPTAETSQSYKKLIQTFFVINLMTFEVFSGRILCPILEEYMKENKYKEMKQLLVILNNLELSITVGEGTKKFFEILFEVIRKRSDVFISDLTLHSAIQESIHLILYKTSPNPQLGASFFAGNLEEKYRLKYYKLYLCSPTETGALSRYLIGNLAPDHTALIIQLMRTKILPLNNDGNEILITQSLVTLLSHFPEEMKETEGLNIIQSLMTTKSLKHLGNDPNFVNDICRIKNSGLCQVIASKILQ
ncbi:uncharacterized protein LOC123307882 isoform X2 [Coccinella septempunctata]|uniref:uncharacterized protein LOC123307882 isoform X2 n=1 Tax=Coccinella septempunctata TaxID=41139 RepID=UPI001D08F32F|nr:uncharacterized protein LOC123307882 isoform X2 [Coccinella septempunctata]